MTGKKVGTFSRVSGKKKNNNLGYLLIATLACLVFPVATAQKNSGEIVIQKDVTYAGKLQLDLYQPKEGNKLPVVVFLHLGAWRAGFRQRFAPYCYEMAKRGFVALTADYRLTPEFRYPAQVDDVKSIVAWLRGNAKKLRIDPKRIALAGASAGGHLALLVGLDNESGIAAIISLYSPTDLSKKESCSDYSAVEAFLGDVDPYVASPMAYASKGDPPVLFLHSDDDALVAPSQSKILHEKLRALGSPSTLKLYRKAGHGFHLRPEYAKQVLDDIASFLAFLKS